MALYCAAAAVVVVGPPASALGRKFVSVCVRVYVFKRVCACEPIKVLIKSKRCADLFMRLEFPTVAWANIFATLVANCFPFFWHKQTENTNKTNQGNCKLDK